MEPSRQSRRIRGNPRGQLPASLRAQDLPINEVLTMLQKVHIGLPTCEIARRTTTRASPVVTTTQPSSPKQAPSHNFMVEHVISPTASWRSSTTPPYLQTLRSQTKPCGASARTHWTWKAWAPSSGSKIPQRHQQIGRPIDRNDEYTPTDVKYFLFNRRMHEWRQHHLPRHQFFKLHARHVLQG